MPNMRMASFGMAVTIATSPILIQSTSKRIKCSSAQPTSSRETVASKFEEAVVTSEFWEAAPFGAIKASKRVVLVRHGQSTWNEEGRIQGSSDFAVLTRKGEAQAETSRQMLSEDSFDVCFSSPLIRSKRTAEIIWDSREEEIMTDSDLREIDLYSFQGLLKHEGKSKFGAAYRQWQIDAANFVIDDHYPVRELWQRARNCWDKILSHESRSVLVVAHNAVNQALVATAIGLGTEFFRMLLQSNCGVSVLDFTPRSDNASPHICLNRLNQTPSSPVSSGAGAGRKASERIILVSQGTLQTESDVNGDQSMNMLGIIQSQKTAELLLDVKVNTIVSSTESACCETAMAVSRVQEAADCLGADCVPRYVEMKQMRELSLGIFSKLPLQDDAGVSAVWIQSATAWKSLMCELGGGAGGGRTVVVVASPVVLVALICQCLNLTNEWLGLFHLDAGSVSVLDFPDGAAGRGVVRCVNYTAHLGRWSIPITKPTPNDEDF